MKKHIRRKEKRQNKKVALHHIDELFDLALENKDRKYSQRYVDLARTISQKTRTPIEKRHKILFCRKCGSFLSPLTDQRIRIRNGNIIYLCKNCKTIRRVRIKD